MTNPEITEPADDDSEKPENIEPITQMDRFKAWYRKNEDTIIVGAISFSLYGLWVYRVIDGRTVKGGSVLTRDDGVSVIVLSLKNGHKQLLMKKITEAKIDDVRGVHYEG